jgi:hypothetical protein
VDLTGAARSAALVLFGAGVSATGGCSSEDPASFSEDALLLPATLFEALPLATDIARDWNGSAFVTSLGGGYTVMDAEGRALNHSFEFHGRFGLQWRRLTVDLVNGVPWTLDSVVPAPPPAFRTLDVFDSDVAVAFAISWAELINADDPGTIPDAQYFAARLLSDAVWPEPTSVTVPADSVAWRVDFLQLDAFSSTDSTPVWWSLARMYIDPDDAKFLGSPVIPPSGRELYPFP